MKKVWILIAAIIVVVGGAITFAALRDGGMPYQQPDTAQETPSQNQTGGTTPPPVDSSRTGQYVDYSAEAVANTDGRKWLFFHAPWCPQCRALEADIERQGVPAGLTIFKVDYDTSTDLKQKYGVTLQTTIVEIDDEGNEVAKYVAYDDPSLDAVFNALGR
jgi:thiol-disulfide isomerase/thioredoxin